MSIGHLQIFIGVICLSIGILAQVLVFRNFTKFGLLKSEYVGFLIGFIAFFPLEFYAFFLQAMPMVNSLAIFLTNLMIYCSLGYCYFHFINLGETARRIRILRELYDIKEGLSLEEILERYNAKEVIERRMKRLMKNRQIVLKNGRYYIGGTAVLVMARIMEALKLMLLGEKIKLLR